MSFRVNDLIEDNEGDKAVVREIAEDGRPGIEWDCRPGVISWPSESYVSWASFTNLSERVRELDEEAYQRMLKYGDPGGSLT